MGSQTLWIVKTATSDHLSRSSKLEDSRIRRHVQRHRQLSRYDSEVALTDVPIMPRPLRDFGLGLKSEERRSLHFFICRTAPELCGWEDEHFWNVLVLQASHRDETILHGLIALAKYHEASSLNWETSQASTLRSSSALQTAKAFNLASLRKPINHGVGLISCILFVILQGQLRDYQFYRLLRSGNEMIEELNSADYGLSTADQSLVNHKIRPLLDRLNAKMCVLADAPASLMHSVRQHQLAELEDADWLIIPSAFATLRSARDCLGNMLQWAHDHVFAAMKSGEMALEFFRSMLSERLTRWQRVLDAAGLANSELLHIAALNGLTLLMTLSNDPLRESDFDAHISSFTHIMNYLSNASAQPNHISFGIDDGLIDIITFVSTRCRGPPTRRRALTWLRSSRRLEGERLSSETATIASAWADLEEATAVATTGRDITSAADIPECTRYRLVSGERYHEPKLLKLTFARSPYNASTRREIWLENGIGKAIASNSVLIKKREQEVAALGPADVIFSPCHAAFLVDKAKKGSYHHIRTERFYFPIPRT